VSFNKWNCLLNLNDRRRDYKTKAETELLLKSKVSLIGPIIYIIQVARIPRVFYHFPSSEYFFKKEKILTYIKMEFKINIMMTDRHCRYRLVRYHYLYDSNC